MNINVDMEILKALLTESFRSVYVLHAKSLKDNGIPYKRANSHVKALTNKGFIIPEEGITKGGDKDKRGRKNLEISYRGLAYLVLKGELSESDYRLIMQKIVSNRKFDTLYNPSAQQTLMLALSKSFEQLRPRINLDYFDEEYFESLIIEDVLLENIMTETLNWKGKLPKIMLTSTMKKALKDLRKPSFGERKIFQLILHNLQVRRRKIDRKIQFLEYSLKLMGA